MRRRSFLITGGAAMAGLAHAFGPALRAAADASRDVREGHPRLLLSGFDAVRSTVATDTWAATWYDKVKAAADTVMTQPVLSYEIPDGLRLLATSREAIFRVYVLSLAHAIEGEQRYRERLWADLAAVCAFPDWNYPKHFLDVAEMTHAVAIGYDWWYDEWSADQRATMEAALVDYGLQPGLDVLNGADTAHDWPHWTNNWNVVCNGGLIVGALAVAERHPDIAAQVMERALDSLARGVGSYAPEGGYPEGPGYWEYATKYLVLTMASLATATGDDTGLSDEPGVSTTVDYPMHLVGPSGSAFNYYDGGSGATRPSEIFWLAQRFGRPDHGWFAKLGAEDRAPSWKELPVGLLWYDPELVSGPVSAGTSRDAYFADGCQVTTTRSGWERAEAVYLAAKAGNNATSHSDLDIGTWIFEALGQRWFVELGSDDYNLPGYFHEPRWTYYRKRTEGQNTILVNPSTDPGQLTDAKGDVIAHGSATDEAWFIVDGSNTTPELSSWRRGWRLFGHRREVLIQDEVTTDEPADAWWFGHTAADIAISEDGRSATLSLAGRELLARIVAPGTATFTELAAAPLWTSPDPEGQNPNNGLRKLGIHLTDITRERIAVQLTPRLPGVATTPLVAVEPLADWDSPSVDVATVAAIAVDGEPIQGFAPENFSYGLELTGGERITATAADDQTEVRVVELGPGGATMIVATRPRHRPGRYLVWNHQPLGPGNFPETIIASTNDGNLPVNTMDGRLDTRWSADGDGEWIAYDMGSDGAVDSVRIAWHSGDERIAYFDIEVALDGATGWTPVLSGQSSGTTAEFETYSFDTVTARYLRIVGHGNSSSGWNSIAEVEVPGRSVMIERDNRLESIDLELAPVPLGEEVPTMLSGTMTDGSTADLGGLDIRYLTLDPETATVSSDGTVAGVREGETVIAALVTLDGHRLVHARARAVVADPDRPRVPVIADTYVRDGSHAEKNFGDDSAMIIKLAPGSGFTRRGFIAFEPEPISRDIESVVLNLHSWVADNNGTEIDLVVRHAGGTFDELAVTWDDQPTIGGLIGRTHVTSDAAWHEIDATEALTAPLRAGDPIALAIVQEPDDGHGLATRVSARESGMGSYLQVVLR